LGIIVFLVPAKDLSADMLTRFIVVYGELKSYRGFRDLSRKYYSPGNGNILTFSVLNIKLITTIYPQKRNYSLDLSGATGRITDFVMLSNNEKYTLK
jgi:hypothetical protein